jgi:S1-C subfamily serine protease
MPGTGLSTPEVVDRLRPSVVHIATEAARIGLFSRAQVARGVGTGFVLDLQGHILTNNHVIEGAQRIIVTLTDGRVLVAEVVGRDRPTDLAVLRVEASNLIPVVLGDSDALQVGSDVVAIGHALDLKGGPTVSKGVVSALERTIQVDERTMIAGLIQTDAAINPGNSGGPLVNGRGEVIGISTAIIAEGRGIGFAISINDAMMVIEQLITNGSVERAFMGIVHVNVTASIARNIGLPVDQGLALIRVLPGFPAAEAGLRENDIIVGLGGEEIGSTAQLYQFLATHKPGETVSVTYYRGDREFTSTVSP